MSDIEIKRADKSDAENIVSLYQNFRAEWSPVTDFNHKLEIYPAVVAYQGSTLIGFVYCLSFAPDIIELANMYVKQGFRSNNLGTEMLLILEGFIKKSNYKGVILFNSDAYETEQLKYSASSFYLRNDYRELAATDMTRIFYKGF